MTLPRGFGRGWDKPKEPIKKCKLGKDCDDDYPHYKQCTVHRWIDRHDDAILGIKIILGFVIFASLGIFAIVSYSNYVDEQALFMFENLNCSQLAEHIADYGEFYKEAEHRYEWLCVNQQVKEFQG